MKFVRAIWKLLVGIKDALVLLLLIIFFSGLYGALSARPAPVFRLVRHRPSGPDRRAQSLTQTRTFRTGLGRFLQFATADAPAH